MKIKKSALISTYAQSVGIEAAKELISKEINAAALVDKENYTGEEIARICGELVKEGGLIRIVAQTLLVQLERKKSEEQALLLDNIETQIWYLTDIETCGAVNKARADFLGLERGNLEGMNLYDMLGREEAGVCIARNHEVFEKKKQTRTEEWFKNGRGKTRLLSITRTPKIDDNGNVEYVICAAEDITKLKKAEEALRGSEEKYRLLAESAQDLIFVIDSDMRIQYSNQFAAGQLGYRPEEIIGEYIEEVFHPDLSNSFKHNLQTVFESGEPLHVEDGFTLPDKELWLDTQLIPLKKESGKIKSILGISRDTTDRKQAEERIEHLNSVLKAIRHVNQLIITEKDRGRLLQKSCDVLTETRGYDAAWLGFLSDDGTFATVVGSRFRKEVARFCEHVMGGDHTPCIKNALAQKDPFMVVDKSRECGDCFFKSACAGKEAVIIRVEYDGRLFGLLALLLAIDAAADDEETQLLMEVAGDIAFALRNMELNEAHKCAEEAQRKSEERFRTIVETAPGFLMICDAEGNNSYVSPKCEELTGYTEEELLSSRRWWVHEDDTPRAKELFERTFLDGLGSKDFEYKAIKKNGELWYASSSWEPLSDSGGKFGGIVFQTIDITERKRAEDRIKASLKMKEVLLREINHRVRNNLQIISSLLNMQARTTKNKDTIDILTESRNRINAMSLIHNQLYESRDISEINMQGVVEKLLRLMFQNYPVQETGITTIVHVAECPLPMSLAVPVGLIVNELLTNAFKYAFVNRKEGKVEVVLRALEKGMASLTVSDDGVGLPEGFDLNTTKTLGLRVVKILAEGQLQGNMNVVSDKGTTFTVEFEIARV